MRLELGVWFRTLNVSFSHCMPPCQSIAPRNAKPLDVPDSLVVHASCTRHIASKAAPTSALLVVVRSENARVFAPTSRPNLAPLGA